MSLLDDGELFGFGAFEFENQELKHIYAEAREYETLANELNANGDEAQELVSELDKKWPYMNKRVHITGNVIVDVSGEEGSSEETIPLAPRYFEDTPAESIGFNMMRVADDEGQNLRWILGHSVIFEMELTDDRPMRKGYTVRHGFAPLDDAVLSYPFESEVAYLDKLQYHFPEVGQEIVGELLKAQNECQAVMALADFDIPMGPHDTFESFEIITDYINSVISFDQKVPYQMSFSGPCYMVEDVTTGSLIPAEAEEGLTLAYPLKIRLFYEDIVNKQTEQKQTIARFGLNIILINVNRDDDTLHQYVIPITEEFTMHDVRSLVYIALRSQTSDA